MAPTPICEAAKKPRLRMVPFAQGEEKGLLPSATPAEPLTTEETGTSSLIQAWPRLASRWQNMRRRLGKRVTILNDRWALLATQAGESEASEVD